MKCFYLDNFLCIRSLFLFVCVFVCLFVCLFVFVCLCVFVCVCVKETIIDRGRNHSRKIRMQTKVKSGDDQTFHTFDCAQFHDWCSLTFVFSQHSVDSQFAILFFFTFYFLIIFLFFYFTVFIFTTTH